MDLLFEVPEIAYCILKYLRDDIDRDAWLDADNLPRPRYHDLFQCMTVNWVCFAEASQLVWSEAVDVKHLANVRDAKRRLFYAGFVTGLVVSTCDDTCHDAVRAVKMPMLERVRFTMDGEIPEGVEDVLEYCLTPSIETVAWRGSVPEGLSDKIALRCTNLKTLAVGESTVNDYERFFGQSPITSLVLSAQVPDATSIIASAYEYHIKIISQWDGPVLKELTLAEIEARQRH